jgi:peptide/nickel transport system permease protein
MMGQAGGGNMRRDYVVRRLIQSVIVLWGAATLNFLLPRIAPGNPIRERLHNALLTGGTVQAGIEDMVRSYNQQFGLDRPLWEQYWIYLWNVLRLDFGYSITQYPAKVMPMILGALPWTIGLLLAATILSFIVGTFLGALIAWPRSPSYLQHLVVPLMGLSSIPYYLFGLVLVYFLGVVLPIFPISGGYAVGTVPELSLPFILDVAGHSLLPASSIVVAAIGFSALGMRGMMVTTAGEDYISFAEAKGLPDRRIFLRYALRNAILPQVTAFALSLGFIVSGSVIVEVVFGYPGIGTLLLQAISGLDYFLIYGIVFITVFAIDLATTLIDLLYPFLDPRISYRRT